MIKSLLTRQLPYLVILLGSFSIYYYLQNLRVSFDTRENGLANLKTARKFSSNLPTSLHENLQYPREPERYVTIGKNLNEDELKESSYMILKDVFSRKYKRLNSNVPINLLLEPSSYSRSKGCAVQFPEIDMLEFNNIYWQNLKLSNSDVAYFYSAHYDNRKLVNNSVRIVSFAETKSIPLIKYCQIFFTDEKVVGISNVSAIHMESSDADDWTSHTYILTCEIPLEFRDQVPGAVSLVESECDVATNVLTVHYDPLEPGEEKQDFAICTKALLYPEMDLSFYLVQYIELAKILGVHKIYIYEYFLHPNMSKVLRYYEILDQVEVTPFTMAGRSINLPGLMKTMLNIPFKTGRTRKWKLTTHNMERAAQNDCLFRNMYKYKYITNFDLDEIMIPSNGETWKEVIDDVISKEKEKMGDQYTPPVGYFIPMGIFTDEFRFSWIPGIPKYMSMLHNVNRTAFLKYYKTIMDPEYLPGMGLHLPKKCIGECTLKWLTETEAFLGHYRYDLNPQGMGKLNSDLKMDVTDTRILNYKEDMVKNVDKALKEIGLL